MKLYLAGPIFGKEDTFQLEFAADMDKLLGVGYRVVNPAMIQACLDRSCWDRGTRLTTWARDKHPGDPASHTYECYIRYDLIEMFKCDAVAYRQGWETSFGSRNEINQAATCGMQVQSVEWWIINWLRYTR